MSNENKKQIQGERTRALLIEAATRLLLANGYSGTTIAVLAKDTQLTKGAIYHHFANKEALLRAVIDHIRSTWEREVGRRVPLSGGAILQLGALFDHQAQLIRKDPSLCLLVNGLMMETESLSQELLQEVSKIYEDFTEFVRPIIERGQTTGDLREDLDSTDMARAIVSIIRGISCSRELELGGQRLLSKMETTKMIVLSGVEA